jgi:hypothetical protein
MSNSVHKQATNERRRRAGLVANTIAENIYSELCLANYTIVPRGYEVEDAEASSMDPGVWPVGGNKR